jgi:hypothetical protein
MSIDDFFLYLLFALVVGCFLTCLRYVDKTKFRPLPGISTALGLVVLGIIVNWIAGLVGLKAWGGIIANVLFDEDAIYHGSAFVAIGYGLLLFSVVRLFSRSR